MPARPLSEEQFAQVGEAVIALAVRSGFEGWRISDVVARTGVSSRTLYKYFPSKEYLLLQSLLSRYGPEFETLFDEGPGSGAADGPPAANGVRAARGPTAANGSAPLPGGSPGAVAALDGHDSDALERVRQVLGPLTEQLVAYPVLTKAVVRALTSAKPGVAPVLLSFSRAMQRAIARAIADGEPGADQLAAAEVVQQVWFAAVVAWACDIHDSAYIDQSVVPALRLIHGSP